MSSRLLTLFLAFNAAASAGITYTVTNLDPVLNTAGGNSSTVTGIAPNGNTTGITYAGCDHVGSCGFVYINGTATIFGIAGTGSIFGNYINSAGQVAGSTSGVPGALSAFKWSAGAGFALLANPYGTYPSEATGIDEAGDVIGWVMTDASSGIYQVIVWKADGTYALFPSPNPGYPSQGAISPDGRYVALYIQTATFAGITTVYHDGVADHSILPAINGSAVQLPTSINNSGIVGARTGSYQALVSDGISVELGPIGPSNVVSINNSGVAAFSHFIYNAIDGLSDLNTMIDSALNITITGVYGIADNGMMAVQATGADNVGRPYLLTPAGLGTGASATPEPATAALLGLSLLALTATNRLRTFTHSRQMPPKTHPRTSGFSDPNV